MLTRFYIDPATGQPHIYNHQVREDEVMELLEKPDEDRAGREGSRIALGQTSSGRYLRFIYVPDPEPDSVVVITAYELVGKPLVAFRRRRRKKVAISMDWLPTLLAAARTQADPTYLPDGISLLPALTSSAAPVARKLFWRYRFRAQRAMRDGNMKWLEIDGNRFLFDLAADPLERANLKERQPELFHRLSEEYSRWNTTMLPEDPASTSHALYGHELADRYGNKKP